LEYAVNAAGYIVKFEALQGREKHIQRFDDPIRGIV
jgi:hypothetical protein